MTIGEKTRSFWNEQRLISNKQKWDKGKIVDCKIKSSLRIIKGETRAVAKWC